MKKSTKKTYLYSISFTPVAFAVTGKDTRFSPSLFLWSSNFSAGEGDSRASLSAKQNMVLVNVFSKNA